jgi:outer membrane protein OmpA-like peptidoglycan-associated protein
MLNPGEMKNVLWLVSLLVAGTAGAQDDNYIQSKYDFIPGEKVIFFDDFSAESIGDFPAAWNTSGSGEIVSIKKFPGRWFQLTKGGYFIPEAKEAFTDNFTIDFDFVPLSASGLNYLDGLDFYLISGTLDDPNEGGAIPGKAGTKVSPGFDAVTWTNYSERDEGYKDRGSSAFEFKVNEKYHIAFWVQKQRLRMYANEQKILDLPRGMIAGYEFNIFRIQTNDDSAPALANFRIAAGLPDLRNRLLKDGKIISYGIAFDVNADKMKPESYSTLKEIAAVLGENNTLRVKIVGHTDADGNEEDNLDLSKRRALSVKNELVARFGIGADRLEADGKGESAPLAPNDSQVNKAKNRRVEFINLQLPN